MLSRAELLQRLQQTFRQYGYEGASMTRIAKATGLGKASLYHYFPEGKEQMAQAVVDDVGRWFESTIFLPLEQVHPPRQRIVSMLEALRQHYDAGNLACLPGLFSQTEERALFGETIARFFARWIASLTQTLTDAGLARDIAQRRAYDGVERIQGALVLSRALADPGCFAAMVLELPDQLLAGSDRATMWTTRVNRFAFGNQAEPQRLRAR